MDETQTPQAPVSQKKPDSGHAQRKLWMVVCLAVLPPVGVAWLWCSDHFSQRGKQWGTIVGAFWLFLLAGSGANAVRTVLVYSVLCGAFILAWRRWGARWQALLRRHDEQYAELNGPKIKRQAHLVLVVLLLVAFAPLAIVAAALSRRFSAREKIAVAVASPFCMIATIGIVASLLLPERALSSRQESSVVDASVVTEAAPPPAASPAPIDSKSAQEKVDDGLALAKQYSDRLAAILDDIDSAPKLLADDTQQAPMVAGAIRRARVESSTIVKELQQNVQPAFDALGGEFSSTGGCIGGSLYSAAANANVAATLFASGLVGDIDASSLEQIRTVASAARSSLREVEQGIEEVKNPAVAGEREREQSETQDRVAARMEARLKQRPAPNPNARAQPYRIVDSAVEPPQAPGDEKAGRVVIVSPTARCFEEYGLTARQAADDFMKATGCRKVDCVLRPSPSSDDLWALAIVHGTFNGDTGSVTWDVVASKLVFTKEEIAIAEAWAAARKKSGSQMTDDIMQVMTSKFGLKKEDILAVPNADLEPFK